MTDTAGETPTIATSKKNERSPSFPFITLTKGLERTRELFDAARRHEMRLPDAAKAMNYGAKSSGAVQSLAALIAYGLVEDSGSGDSRKFKVTDLGFKALEDQRPGAREAALAEAAMNPKMIAEHAEKWKDGRPSDAICISELRIDRGFSEDGAKAFLRVFDDALSYAKVGSSGKRQDTGDYAAGTGKADNAPAIAAGDLVRVESGGQIVFEKTRVRHVEGGWVFVEASKSGAKMTDVTLLEKGSGAPEVPPVLEFADPAGSRGGDEMDRFTVDEGVVKITFPSDMTTASVEELEQFFQLFIKKAKRRAEAGKPKPN